MYKMSYATQALAEQVSAIAKRAGDAILEIYQRDFAVYDKSDSSPLTEADLAAHKIICQGLEGISDLPILSEESASIGLYDKTGHLIGWLTHLMAPKNSSRKTVSSPST